MCTTLKGRTKKIWRLEIPQIVKTKLKSNLGQNQTASLPVDRLNFTLNLILSHQRRGKEIKLDGLE